jgi:murein DD-endopeptidase MepM/ murein hydrolase activator NlpD
LRYLSLAVIGAVALSAIGSILTGTLLAPTTGGPVGVVAGARQGPDPTAGSAPEVPQPVRATAPLYGGTSLEARDDLAAHPRPAPPSELTDYRWPLLHGRITLPFGPSKWGSRIVDGELFHDGLDLATFCGDRVVAAHDGVVLAASRHYDVKMGWIGDLKPYLDRLDEKGLWPTLPIVVVIDDGNGYRSMYAHLSKAVVKAGAHVTAGQLIGYEGKTGRASGCHLHYGLFSPLETARFGIDPGVVERMKLPPWQTARIDPLLVLPSRSGTTDPTGPHEGGTAKEPLAAE